MTMLPNTDSASFTSIPTNFAIGTGLPTPIDSAPFVFHPVPPAIPSLPLVKSSQVWGADFSVINMQEAVDYLDRVVQVRKPAYAITANLNYLMLCAEEKWLDRFTKGACLVLCDGMPILWRSRFNPIPLPERVAGSDLVFELAQRCAAKKYRLFLMGGAEGVAQKAADRLQELYPRLEIAGVECPPFRPQTQAEHDALCQRIKRAKPDVLLVAFGQPKGEFWIGENYQRLGVPLSIQIGASFDFIAGTAIRAPKILQKIGFEWAYRMFHDPKRLVPRYARNAWFLLRTLRRELLQATR